MEFIPLTDVQQRSFDEHGFVVVRNAIDADVVQRLTAAGDRFMETAGPVHNYYANRYIDMWYDDTLLGLATNPRILPLIVQLLSPSIPAHAHPPHLQAPAAALGRSAVPGRGRALVPQLAPRPEQLRAQPPDPRHRVDPGRLLSDRLHRALFGCNPAGARQPPPGGADTDSQGIAGSDRLRGAAACSRATPTCSAAPATTSRRSTSSAAPPRASS